MRRSPSVGHALAVAAALLVLGVSLPAATGTPPPRSVCEPCHEDIERGAEAAGVLAAVAMALATLPIVALSFSLLHLPGLVVLLVFLEVLYRLRAGADGAPDRRQAGRWAVGSVVVYLAGTLLVLPPATVPGMFWAFGTALFVSLAIAIAIAVANWLAYRVSGARTAYTPGHESGTTTVGYSRSTRFLQGDQRAIAVPSSCPGV
jgi:hypothetical protein